MIKKLLVLIFLSFFLLQLSGCGGKQGDSSRTRSEGAGVGAAGGAVLGALLGQVIGGDTGATLLGAAIGAAAGGAAGYAYGDHVAGQKEKYASEEDWLNASIYEAQVANDKIADFNQQLKKDIKELQKEADQVKKQYTIVSVQKGEMLVTKKNIDTRLESAKDTLAVAQEEMNAQTHVLEEARKSGQSDFANDINSEIEQLKAHITKLENNIEELASMSASMAV